MAQNQRQFAALLGRLGKPELEFSQPWAPGTTIKSPAGLRTDKFITAAILHWRGRIVIATANITHLTIDALGQLLQECRLYGQHAVYGNIRPQIIRGGHLRMLNRIYRGLYLPRDQQASGNTQNWGQAGAVNVQYGSAGFGDYRSQYGQVEGTYDLDVFWVWPFFPLPMSLNLAPMFSIKGPDWAGNLFMECDTGDATALGGVVANTTFSAYGSGSGSPTLYASVCRPNLTVATMNKLSPAIAFRSYKYLDNIVTGNSFSNGLITTLNIGKKMASVHTESGVLFGTLTAGQRAYGSYLDSIITRVMVGLDSKDLVSIESGFSQQEWDQWLGQNQMPVGWNAYNFTRESGNPDSGFPAETLTAARRFEVDGDVTAAANQGSVLIQDEILGTPALSA
jgi:hypothetical protein